MNKISRIWCLLLLSPIDHCSAQQTVNYCQFEEIERSIDKADSLYCQLYPQWEMTDTLPERVGPDSAGTIFISNMDAFHRHGLPRPSYFVLSSSECSEDLFMYSQYQPYLDLLTALTKQDQQVAIPGNDLRNSLDDVVHHIPRSLNGYSRAIKDTTVSLLNNEFDCVLFSPGSSETQMKFLLDTLQTTHNSFEEIMDLHGPAILLMNAGMFQPNWNPQGLFVSDCTEYTPLNMEYEKYGNFYLDPAGVLYIDLNNHAYIVTREDYHSIQDTLHVKNATQSGPMLIVDGKIHPQFDPQSKNLNIRNGVGIGPDGLLVFAISKQPVSLYQFASLFKEIFGCENALYLDGAISNMYAPSLGRQNTKGRFGPMIGIFPSSLSSSISPTLNSTPSNPK